MLLASVELFTFPNIWIRPVANGKSTAARTARDFQQLKTNLYEERIEYDNLNVVFLFAGVLSSSLILLTGQSDWG